MRKTSVQKHVTLYPSHVDVLDSIIEKNPDINNYSEAIRFLCMSYEPDTNTTTTSNQAKLNAMGKEISIMTEIIAEFADLYLKDTGVLIGTNSKVYQESFRFFVHFYQSFFTGLLFLIKYDKFLVALHKRVAFSRINTHYFLTGCSKEQSFLLFICFFYKQFFVRTVVIIWIQFQFTMFIPFIDH